MLIYFIGFKMKHLDDLDFSAGVKFRGYVKINLKFF